MKLPFTRFELPNGLRVIVHEDHKAPVVGMLMFYKVGGRHDPPGRTEMTHLLEHLMFGPSLHLPSTIDAALTELGAVEVNGTNQPDYTVYAATVPAARLERALFISSERMGYTAEALTQEDLDRERAAVKAELAEQNNRPGARARTHFAVHGFPPGHPYARPAEADVAELDQVTLEELRAFQRRWYAPDNAVLVLAGSVTPRQAQEWVALHFGDIPPAEPAAEVLHHVPTDGPATFYRLKDPHADRGQLRHVLLVDGHGAGDISKPALLAALLNEEHGILKSRLIGEHGPATDVEAAFRPGQLCGTLEITVHLQQGADPAQASDLLEAALESFAEQGPSADLLKAAVRRAELRVLSGLETVAGPIDARAGKAWLLGLGELFRGDPSAYSNQITSSRAATPADIAQTLRRARRGPRYTLFVVPDRTKTPSEAPRSRRLPPLQPVSAAPLPAVRQATLNNGIPLYFVARRDVPLVHVRLMFEHAGTSADDGLHPGAAETTAALGVRAARNRLAAEEVWADIDASTDAHELAFTLHARSDQLTTALAAVKDALSEAPASEDLVNQAIRGVAAAQEKARKRWYYGAYAVLPPLVFGTGHPLGRSYPGLNHEGRLAGLTRDHLARFQETYLTPRHAAVFAAGDASLEELTRALNAGIGALPLRSPEAIPKMPLAGGKPGQIYIWPQRGSDQVKIFAAASGPTPSEPDALRAATDLLGGRLDTLFYLEHGRLNQNLRTDKGWTYLVGNRLHLLGPIWWLFTFCEVEARYAVPAMEEISAEYRAMATRPPDAAALAEYQEARVNVFAADLEKHEAVLQYLATSHRHGGGPGSVNPVPTPEAVAAAARDLLSADRLIWVLAGDPEVLKTALRAAGMTFETLPEAD